MLSSALLMGTSQILNRGSVIIATVILSRSLSADDFAAFAYFLITTTMFAAYASSGLGVSATKFFAQAQYDKDAPPPIGILYCASIALATLIAFALTIVPSSWISGPLSVSRAEIIAGALIMTTEIIPRNGIIGLEKYKQNLIISAFSFIITITGILYSAQTQSYTTAVYTILFTHAFRTVFASYNIFKTISPRTIFRETTFSRQAIKTVLGLTGPMALVTILASSGVWLIGRLLLLEGETNNAFRQFAIAIQWYSLALFGPGIISQITLPILVKSRVKSAAKKSSNFKIWNLNNAVKKTIAASFASSLVGAIGALFAPEIYGSIFSNDRYLIVFFLIAAILVSPANTIGNALIASDQQWYWLFLSIIQFGIMISLSYLHPYDGALSAAFALGTGGFFLTISSYLRARSLGILE